MDEWLTADSLDYNHHRNGCINGTYVYLGRWLNPEDARRPPDPAKRDCIVCVDLHAARAVSGRSRLIELE